MKENWCKVFDKDDYEILAYHNDLKSYWLKSYGHEINSRVSLLLYKDLFKSIDNFILNKSQNRYNQQLTPITEINEILICC